MVLSLSGNVVTDNSIINCLDISVDDLTSLMCDLFERDYSMWQQEISETRYFEPHRAPKSQGRFRGADGGMHGQQAAFTCPERRAGLSPFPLGSTACAHRGAHASISESVRQQVGQRTARRRRVPCSRASGVACADVEQGLVAAD